ncbi:MAG: hypothetical protein COA78_20275 [Blastopirellula sp.]|nr:MAG: hypothetical protein COA78_20275 [Blastopirellula sp.]
MEPVETLSEGSVDNTQQMDSSESFAIDDLESSEVILDPLAGKIVNFVEGRFNRAEGGRYQSEERWLLAYQNYRGIYGPDVQFTETEKSRVFVKVTKTKVLAAYGQIIEVLFGNNKIPISINPTVLPEGVVESVHFDVNPQAGMAEGTKPTLQPGETMQTLSERLGPLADVLEPVKDKLVEGPGTLPTQVTFSPAEVSAKKMQKKIHDQLDESNASRELRYTAFECPLFGTGVIKGPFATEKEYPSWGDKGEYQPVKKTVPVMSNVSIWNYYPDPDANSSTDNQFVIERHKISRTRLRALNNRPFFRKEAIDRAIEAGENYQEKWWESQMDDDGSDQGVTERFEALEFWGYIDIEELEGHDIEIPEELENESEVCVNIWTCNGQLLRLVMNPFKPLLIPYYAVPYETNPYSQFGVGIAENMADTQILMNGFMRMAIDNAALSGNLIIEIDETNLVPGQDMKVFPGKTFRRQGGAPGQAIFGTKFPNVANENMQLFDKARVLADESTGFPSFAHGQTGVQGVGRTASGISMLMSAANGSIRTVVKNFDDYLLGPLGKGYFHFNMQFDFDPDIKGDLEVKAEGTESMMANEVRSQRLMQFLGVVQNPVLAPFAKMDYIIREIAKSMDLDPDKVTNNLGDAAIQAEILKGFQVEVPQGSPPMEGGPPSPTDTSGAGGGNVGVGQAPIPGEQGFSGNVQ